MIMKKQLPMFMKKTGVVLLPPAAMYLVMELICLAATGGHLMSNMLDAVTFVKNCGIAICAALAMSLNLGAGRIDMSLGAQRLIACVIGGNLAMALGLGVIPTLLLCMALGTVSGTLVGFMFVKTKIAPMILSLGMMLIYECVVFQLYPEGVHFYGRSEFAMLSDSTFIIVITVMVVALMIFLLNYSKFGYNYRAASASPSIAANAGIDIEKNIVITYALAGALIGISSIFEASYIGTVEAPLNMGSMEKVFTALTPILVGRILALYSNTIVGTVSAVVALRLLNQGLSVMQVESNTSSVINTMLLLAAFMLVTFIEQKNIRKRIAEKRKLAAA